MRLKSMTVYDYQMLIRRYCLHGCDHINSPEIYRKFKSLSVEHCKKTSCPFHSFRMGPHQMLLFENSRDDWFDLAMTVLSSMGDEFWYSEYRDAVIKECGYPWVPQWFGMLARRIKRAGYCQTNTRRASATKSRNGADEFKWVNTRNMAGATTSK